MDAPETGIAPVRDYIDARLKASPRMKGIRGFRGGVDNGVTTVTNEAGDLIPYYVIVFGGRGKVRGAWQGITGTRDDLRRFVFGVEVYAKNEEEVDRVSDDVWDILEGCVPPNAGEVSGVYSGAIENPLQLRQNHTRDGMGLIFETHVGTVTR